MSLLRAEQCVVGGMCMCVWGWWVCRYSVPASNKPFRCLFVLLAYLLRHLRHRIR